MSESNNETHEASKEAARDETGQSGPPSSPNRGFSASRRNAPDFPLKSCWVRMLGQQRRIEKEET